MKAANLNLALVDIQARNPLVTLPILMSHEWHEKEVRTLGALQIELSNTVDGLNYNEGYGYLKENESEIFEYVSKCLELAWEKSGEQEKCQSNFGLLKK